MNQKLVDAIRAGTHGEEAFLQSVENNYRVSREDIIPVIEELGFVKARIITYFEVHRYLTRKGISPEDIKAEAFQESKLSNQQFSGSAYN
ncbi:MAG: hypothetical protein JO301_08290 [Chitinophagaceae bacterium]|nr:hypothetical protein [Chitinophagaceae bacterium]